MATDTRRDRLIAQYTLACTDRADEYTDEILDFGPHTDGYHRLTPEQRDALAARRADHEDRLKQICYTCPALLTCAAENLDKNVYGVVGGLTETERAAARTARGIPHPTEPDDTPARPHVPADADIYPADKIPIGPADHPIYVSLPRGYTRTPIPPSPCAHVRHTAATLNTLPPGQPIPTGRPMSGLTAAALDILIDGNIHTLDELADALGPLIPDHAALHEWAAMLSDPTDTPHVKLLRPQATQVPTAARLRRGRRRKVFTTLEFMVKKTRYVAGTVADGYQITRPAAETWNARRNPTGAPRADKVA